MRKSKSIFLLGPYLNIFLLWVISLFKNNKYFLIDSSLPQNCKIKNINKFHWNKEDQILKLQINSLAFKLLKNKEKDFFKDNIFFLEIQKKIFVERYSHILMLIGLSNKFKKKDKIFIIMPQIYKALWKDVFIYLKENKKNVINFQKNIQPIFLGLPLLTILINYCKSHAVLLFFLSNIKNIRLSISKKTYKLGLLSWGEALKIRGFRGDNYGLDSVLPNDMPNNEVVVYSRNKLTASYQESIIKNNFNMIDFQNNNVFKLFTFSDLSQFFKILIKTNYLFIIKNFSIDLTLIDQYPKVILNFLKWNKFTDLYFFDISISYNDYGLSDLIRNKIFLSKGIECWSYVHSMTDGYLFSKKELLISPQQSFIDFSKRYYLLPNQYQSFKNSGISSNENILIGPLFQNYKKKYNLNKAFKNKIIISIFSSTLGENSVHSYNSHKCFFLNLFQFMKDVDNNYLFIIKIKNFKKDINKHNKIFKNKLCNYLIRNKKMILIKEEVESQELINCSNAVISMAFTSPTFEALASNKPAIFFDPYKLAKNNYLEGLNDLYINDKQKLNLFIESIVKEKEISSWIKNIRKEIGLEKANLGIEKIKNDLKGFYDY